MAVNCGKDTDCTGATAGAIMGIINPDCIEEKWLKPIGRGLVLNKQITNITHPPTLDGFTDMIISLKERLDKGNQLLAGGRAQPIHAKFAFAPAATFDDAEKLVTSGALAAMLKPILLPGTHTTLPASVIADDALVVSYTFNLRAARNVRLMFNTRQACKAFIDGKPSFTSKGGPMAPSFHRVPNGQFQDLTLEAGRHEFTIVAHKPANGTDAEWVVGVGDGKDHQWIEDAFIV